MGGRRSWENSRLLVLGVPVCLILLAAVRYQQCSNSESFCWRVLRVSPEPHGQGCLVELATSWVLVGLWGHSQMLI